MQLAGAQIKPGARKVADNAEPVADEVSEGYIKPAADTVAKEAEPQAKKLTEDNLKPAADQVRIMLPESYVCLLGRLRARACTFPGLHACLPSTTDRGTYAPACGVQRVPLM